MKRAGRGSIIFIGATASRRGVARTAAFAPAKAAQKSLAESMARHLWPSGIHVSLIIVDGVVDLPRTRAMMKDKPDAFFIKPDHVADLALSVTQQEQSAWSFEVEARPFSETW
jgi:NAD(P)-dependent dehydrogenase (short-subunit alcohol dehydrogenase family)